MTIDLDEYEAAYARVERRLELERDWGAVEARIRRRLRRPTWRLVRTVLLVLLGIAMGLDGVETGWGVALGLCLSVLPGRVSDVRRRRRELAEVDSADDVRAIVEREWRRWLSRMF